VNERVFLSLFCQTDCEMMPLHELVSSATARAFEAKALHTLNTSCELVPALPGAPPFLFRKLLPSPLAALRKPTQSASAAFDSCESSPFLRPEPLLTVEAPKRGTGGTHNLLLNKYPVVPRHLLLCTAAFASQQDDLTPSDICALEFCVRHAFSSDPAGALAFYNCGAQSGASQGHKHMQLIPAAPDFGPGPFFLDGIARAAQDTAETLPGLGFRHAFCKLREDDDAAVWAEKYRSLLRREGLGNRSCSYSFLCTAAWMIVVPRRCECCVLATGETVSINAMGFAGSVLVCSDSSLAEAKSLGPLGILRSCAFPL